jgi:hypothetical protein
MQEFQVGWFADPIFGGAGDYPPAMRKVLGDRLPQFTEEERRLLNGSADFFGLNSYGASWVTNYPADPAGDLLGGYAKVTEEGFPHGGSAWLYGAGWGLRQLLNWINFRYNHPIIYVTEGGWSISADSAEEGAWDPQRVSYYANYTASVLAAAMEDGVDVRGYFAWSLMDNFEWEQGYVQRFGVVYNDFVFGDDPNGTTKHREPTEGTQVRRRKESSCWLEAVWTENALQPISNISAPLCVNAKVFSGNYDDPQNPNCVWTINVGEGLTRGTITADPWPCTGVQNATGLLPLRVSFSGGSIVADFERTGGPVRLLGYWNRAHGAINWGDGNTWSKVNDGASYAHSILQRKLEDQNNMSLTVDPRLVAEQVRAAARWSSLRPQVTS